MFPFNFINFSLTMLLSAFMFSCISDGVKFQHQSNWQSQFDLTSRDLSSTGRNQYFILEPGYQIVLEGPAGKVEITVLDEIKIINGITTRVLEEREWTRGELSEISRNFFSIDTKTKDVFYFGEDVDMYRGGKIVSNDGAWLAGTNGAEAGLIMPGSPLVGMKYYQEQAPGIAMDRCQIIKLDDELETPVGHFKNCLLTKEGSALNLIEFEFKTYAPNVGLIQDEKLLLTSYGFINK
jgi:hypothetical protein